jgi:hypothetical protein
VTVRWFQIPDQPSSNTRAIRRAEEKVKRMVTEGTYFKLEQWPVGRSMGTDTYVYFPCDTPKAKLEETARAGGDRGALEMIAKGDCLR